MSRDTRYRQRRFGGGAPKAVGAVLERALRGARLDRKLDRYAAFPRWPEIVGEEIARRAVPEKIIAGGVLVVRAVDSAWAQELSLRKIELVERLRQAAPEAAIEDIRFRTGNPELDEQRPRRHRKRQPSAE